MPEIVLETRFKAVNKTEDILAFGAYNKSGRQTICKTSKWNEEDVVVSLNKWKGKRLTLNAYQRIHPLLGGKHARRMLCFVSTQTCQFSKPCFSPIFLDLLILQKFWVRCIIIWGEARRLGQKSCSHNTNKSYTECHDCLTDFKRFNYRFFILTIIIDTKITLIMSPNNNFVT